MTQAYKVSQTPETTKRLHCAEIWGGTGNVDLDITTGPVTASLFSAASEGQSGGDIYYLSLCEDEAIARIAIADVVGHGDSVSRISRWIYSALVTRMNNVDGSGVLTDLNALTHQIGLEAMTTAAVLSFQSDDGSLYLSYAGHPPVWVRRVGETLWQPCALKSHEAMANIPLGAFSEATYDQERVQLNSGDRLVLHTDGLIDASNSAGDEFGLEKLQAALSVYGDGGLADLKNRLLAAVHAHTGGAFDQDDMTLMVIEVN